eukprot:3833539-Pyramimonas_sp.AAC.1
MARSGGDGQVHEQGEQGRRHIAWPSDASSFATRSTSHRLCLADSDQHCDQRHKQAAHIFAGGPGRGPRHGSSLYLWRAVGSADAAVHQCSRRPGDATSTHF